MAAFIRRVLLVAGHVVVLTLALLCASAAHAQQPQASASLTVTATVQSSITLTFANNASVGSPGFCPLTNAGTNNVGLDMGTASWTGGATSGCVNYIANAGPATYEVNSAFDVVVNKANTASLNYRLAASLVSVPPANVTWLANALALTTAAQTLSAATSYGRSTTTLRVQVKNSVPAQTLAETISFVATAN